MLAIDLHLALACLSVVAMAVVTIEEGIRAVQGVSARQMGGTSFTKAGCPAGGLR